MRSIASVVPDIKAEAVIIPGTLHDLVQMRQGLKILIAKMYAVFLGIFLNTGKSVKTGLRYRRSCITDCHVHYHFVNRC